MVLRHVADDTEAEARATGLASPTGIDSIEAFEDSLEVLGRDTDALVLDCDQGGRTDVLAVVVTLASTRSTEILTRPPRGEYTTAFSSSA